MRWARSWSRWTSSPVCLRLRRIALFARSSGGSTLLGTSVTESTMPRHYTPQLWQHQQVCGDGHQLQLRQHAEHGGRVRVLAVLADAASADLAQQFSLRPVAADHSDR